MIQNFFSYMSFGNYLRSIRKAAGLTQKELAAQITARGHNVTDGAISNIERRYYLRQDGSENQPAKQLVILAAEVCGADVIEALKKADYNPLDEDADISFSLLPVVDPIDEMLEMLDSLSPEMKLTALRQIKGVVNSLIDLELRVHVVPITDELTDDTAEQSKRKSK